MEQSLTVVLNVSIGQCGPDMISRIESHSRWNEISNKKDAKGLIEVIKSHCYHSSSNCYPCVSALGARIKLCNCRQCEDQSLQDYIKELNALHDVVKAVGGGQGVGVIGEVFTEVERMFQSQYGTLPVDPELIGTIQQRIIKIQRQTNACHYCTERCPTVQVQTPQS